MQSCQKHCSTASESIDKLTQTIESAKQSNDPAKMRAALDQAEKPLADMKQHMSMCMNMMSMMQNMHKGKMGSDHMNMKGKEKMDMKDMDMSDQKKGDKDQPK